MSATATIEALSRELERMREERDYYKREAGAVSDCGFTHHLQVTFGLTPKEARLLEVLRRRPGMAVKEPLFAAAWGDDADRVEIKILDIYICKLRSKLGHGAIITHWGRGYELAPSMRTRINESLAQKVAA